MVTLWRVLRQEGESYTGTGVGEMVTLWRVSVPDDRRGGELYRNGSWGDDNAVAGGGAGRREGESYTGTGVGEMITLWRCRTTGGGELYRNGSWGDDNAVAVPDDRRGRAIQERELGR